MNIQEMHNTFLVLSQQVGLHLVRGILPETIDVFLNAEIEDLVQKELIDNSIIINQIGDISNADLTPFNLFLPLVRVNEIRCNSDDIAENNDKYISYKINLSDSNLKPMIYTSSNVELDNGVKTSARLISHKLVQNTINDYCNRPTSENPITTIIKDDSNKWLMVYGDKDFKLSKVMLYYIKYPNTVKLDDNNPVDCDLPNYVHYKIVENAVRRFQEATNSNKINNQ